MTPTVTVDNTTDQEILAEILCMTDQPPAKPREAEQKFLGRLVRALNALDNDEYETLTEGAQAWSNNGVKAIKASTDIQGFGDDSKTVEAPAKKSKPKKAKGGAKPPARPPRPKKEKAAETTEDETPLDREEKVAVEAEKKPKRKKAKGVTGRKPVVKAQRSSLLRQFSVLAIENPDVSPEDLLEIGATQGIEMAISSIKTLQYWVRMCTGVLAEQGKLKK